MARVKEVVGSSGHNKLLTPRLWDGGEQKCRVKVALMICDKDGWPTQRIKSIAIAYFGPAGSSGHCAADCLERSSPRGLS
jgi:hypothetical protein